MNLDTGCMNAEEVELVRLVNEYRVQNGRPALPAGLWLATTARWKVWDRINNPSAVGGVCNPHSWSAAMPSLWSAVCYTPDHAQAQQMWNKPYQISQHVYTGNGFELTADTGGTQSALSALNQWKGSPAHNAVILQTGTWSTVGLAGMGTGVEGNFGVLWFGDGVNSGGLAVPCQAEVVFASGFE